LSSVASHCRDVTSHCRVSTLRRDGRHSKWHDKDTVPKTFTGCIVILKARAKYSMLTSWCEIYTCSIVI
jgi:hypothetical protein